MTRKLLTALWFLLALSIPTYTLAESSSAETLVAKLQEVRKLVRAGANYDEYKKQVAEITTDLARWESDPDTQQGSVMTKLLRGDSVIRHAAQSYIAALNVWQGNDDSEAKLYWTSADADLVDFDANYRNRAKSNGSQ